MLRPTGQLSSILQFTPPVREHWLGHWVIKPGQCKETPLNAEHWTWHGVCCSHKTTNCGYLTCSKSTKDQGRQNPSMSGKAFRRSNPYLKMTGNWWDCGHCEIAHGPVDGHTYTHTGTAIRAQRVISKRSQCGSGLCCMCILVDCSEEVEGKTKRCIWSKYIICMSGILKNKEDI